MLSGSEDYTLRLWDLPTGRLLRVLEGHQEKVCTLALSTDGTRAVSGAYDETVIVWDLPLAGRPLCTLRGHASLLTDVAITPDGRVVVSAAMDRTVRVWDVASGQARAVWDAHADVVETVAICPDGRTLLSGGMNDSHLRIWDLQTLEQSTALEGPFNSIEKITVGPQGRIALCAVDDTWRGSLSTLDLDTRTWHQHLRGHTDTVGDIALSRDESLAASVSMDHTLRLWNLREGAGSPSHPGRRTRRCRDSPQRKLGRCRKRVRHAPLRPARLARNRNVPPIHDAEDHLQTGLGASSTKPGSTCAVRR